MDSKRFVKTLKDRIDDLEEAEETLHFIWQYLHNYEIMRLEVRLGVKRKLDNPETVLMFLYDYIYDRQIARLDKIMEKEFDDGEDWDEVISEIDEADIHDVDMDIDIDI